MDIILSPLPPSAAPFPHVLLAVDRRTLAKRRWHAAAEDGREFGFDLAEPLHDGVAFFRTGAVTYVIAQQPEPVLEIALSTAAESALVGWLVGNLHFSLQFTDAVIRVPDDSALRQMLERERIQFTEASRVFHPFRPGHVH
jgi:urease accessory protein